MTVDFVAGPGDAGASLGGFLRRCGVSLGVVRGQKYLENGILVNGAHANTNQKLAAGDLVQLCLPPEAGYSARPERLPLTVRYRSRDALVVDKPAGMVTHPGPSHPGRTLANAFCGMMEGQGRAGIFRPVGRLDGDTSGLALMAMNAAAPARLADTSEKTYLAVAGGQMPLGNGAVSAPLAAAAGSTVRQQAQTGGRPSHTDYTVLAACPQASLVRVRPQTGRTHQIRAHFAHLGHPLLGDALYGGGQTLLKRHALHCAVLAFEELGGNRPRLWCPPPDDIRFALAALGLELRAEDFIRQAVE